MVIVAVPAAVGVVITALMWTLLIMAAFAFATVLFRWIAENVPLIGGAFANAAGAFAQFVENFFTATANAAVGPLARVVAAVPIEATQLVDQAIAVLRALFLALGLMTNGAVSTATDAMQAAFSALLAPLTATVAFIQEVQLPNLQWFIEAVQAELWNAWHQHRTETWEADLALGASIETASATAAAELGWAIDGVRAETRDAITGVEAQIGAAVGAVQGEIDWRVAAGLDPLQREIAALEQALAEAIPGIEVRIREITDSQAATAAATATAIATLTEWIRTCGEPLCSTFGDEIPFMRAFNDLLAVGTVGALVAAAISDPEATAARVDGMVGGPLSTVASVYQSVAA